MTALREKYALQITQADLVFEKLYLEYLPIMEGQTTVLKPYWCFSGDHIGERFHAHTGEDLTYGG